MALHDIASATIPELDSEVIAEILPELAQLEATIADEIIDPASVDWVPNESAVLPIDEGGLSRILLTAFTMGMIYAQTDAEPAQILVGITPEDAASITTGLFGPGATITLSVVRDQPS